MDRTRDTSLKITYQDGTTRTVAPDELRRLFPAVVYSQGELADIRKKGTQQPQLSDLLQFVNPGYKQKNDEFESEIGSAKAAVKSAIRAVVDDWRLQSELRNLTTKRDSLRQRADALERSLPKRSQDDQDTLVHFDEANEFSLKLVQASKHADQILQRLESVISELRNERNLSTDLEGVVRSVQKAYHDLYAAFDVGVVDLRDDLIAKRSQLETAESEWLTEFRDARHRRNDVLRRLGTQQTVAKQIIRLRQDMTKSRQPDRRH